jgi:phosphatidylinositol-3-phosphatase
MKSVLIGLTAATIVAGTSAAASAEPNEAVPRLDHVFVLVLENHNSFTSFGANGILDNPQALHIQALAKKYNFAANYNAVWHPSLPNYVAMIARRLDRHRCGGDGPYLSGRQHRRHQR